MHNTIITYKGANGSFFVLLSIKNMLKCIHKFVVIIFVSYVEQNVNEKEKCGLLLL